MLTVDERTEFRNDLDEREKTLRRSLAYSAAPWDYVASTEHHGPYVTNAFGSTICDCYVMSNPSALSVRNGGDSKPIHHLAEMADPNARLIAAAPELLSALLSVRKLIAEGAITGFNPADGDWADRLYASQADTSAAINKAISHR